MTIEFRRALNRPVTMRAEDTTRKIGGYGAVFYNSADPGTEYRITDKIIERIMPGAFDSISRDVISTFNHNPDYLLARQSSNTLRIVVDDIGLRYEMDIDEADPDHVRLARKIERGDVDGSSIWFRIASERATTAGDLVVYDILSADLIEVGPVTMPAYLATTAETRTQYQRLRQSQVAARKQMDLDLISVSTF